MEVTYRNRPWDQFLFSLYQTPRVRNTQIAFGFVLLIFSRVNLDAVRQMEVTLANKVAVFVIMGIAEIVFMLIVLLLFTGLSVLTSQQKNTRMDCKVLASANGLVVESSEGRNERKWSGIHKIGQNSSFIFIYLSDRMAYVIPKNAFTDSTEAEKFFRYVYGLWGRSKRKPADTFLVVD